MLVYDENLDEMVDDNRKTYECPRCDMYWTNEDCKADDFEAFPKDEALKSLTVLNIDDGKEIEYRKYVEKLCPDCSEMKIDGRLKGPYTRVDPMFEGEILKCQVCGSRDFVLKLPDIVICNDCNTFHYGEFETVGGIDYVRDYFGYREDLDTKWLNENFEMLVKIILDGNPVEIK